MLLPEGAQIGYFMKCARPVIPSAMLHVWHSLTVRRRRQLLLLLVMMVFSALVEVIGIASVLPFLGALTNASALLVNPIAQSILLQLHVVTPDRLILVVTLLFVSVSILSGAIRFVVMKVGLKLSYAIGADISEQVYRHMLYQPYRIHADRNSSEVIAAVMSKVFNVTSVINAVLQMISSSLIFFAVVLFAIWINPMVALVAIVILGGSYWVMSLRVRSRLRLNGQKIAAGQTRVVKILQESFGGIRDILLDSNQGFYCKIYQSVDGDYRRTIGDNMAISASPRYVIETLSTVLIAVLAYLMLLSENGAAAAIPILGALALSAQRILPVMNTIYTGWAAIKGNYASLEDVVALLSVESSKSEDHTLQTLKFTQTLMLDNVCFRYHSDGEMVLQGVALSIPKGSRVGFVGKTGSGKSTLIDIVMGLLDPEQGCLRVDGLAVTEKNRRAWQRNIAHVPQSIFLSDASIAENVAFGIPREQIDMEQVIQAARIAQIADYIEAQPHGYDTFVGERGVRLSGGQRQRIGIARAVYKRVDVLVLDEATSALDASTEREVMAAIGQLSDKLTVLMIAHRLTTVSNCDFIVVLDAGRIVAQGGYQELLNSSDVFRQMVMHNAL